jgi:pyruvate/2-oxoglutarate/acetoin dehydrogenase E1 component
MRQLPFIMAINEAFKEEMRRDDKVFVIGEDVQAGTFIATAGLVQEFGKDRVMDTPLSEQAIAGAAIGSAMMGYRPIVDLMFADFMWCCADEIFLKAAKWHFIHAGKVNIPVVIFANMGGGVKVGPEHSQTMESVIMHTPGLKLVVPSNAYDAKGLLKTAIRDNSPVVFLYHKLLLGAMGDCPEEEYTIPFGVADIKQKGTDVTVIATAYMVNLALKAAKQLEGKVSVEVIDLRTLEPLDINTIITSVKKTGRVVIVDEDTLRCGVHSEIAMQIMEKAFDSLDCPIQRVGAANMPIPGGFLEAHVLPKVEDIVAAIGIVTGKKRS